MNYKSIGEVKDPISVEDAKTHLRVISRSDDAYIKTLIRAAREMCEAWTGQAFSMQSVRQYFDSWPYDGVFHLALSPLRSITSISYVNTEGETVDLDVDDFYVGAVGPTKIKLKETQTIPSVNCYSFDPIVIEYVVGIDTTQEFEEIPALILQGIKEHVADMYVNRTAVNIARDGRIAIQIPGPIQRLYGPFRVRV
jgi:uncharacterized phiE125 gp8 family phage protein